jgi:magnesium-transporting ATPase (P-type)
MLFSFTNHFELFCLFEYLNSLLVLYILVSVPTVKPSLNLLKTPQGYNTKFMSSYFFLPALLNYFFLLFLISVCLFYIYLYFISDTFFLISFNDLKFLQGSSFFSLFLLLFLIFKLGVAPLHF